jgi:putative chitinase
MTPEEYADCCAAAAGRPLGAFGLQLGTPMAAYLPGAGIDTNLRLAHFLAQAAHETASFRTLVEYGNAAYFERYDGRKDLGNTQPGDGFRFRGRGIFQLTGRNNYARFGGRIGVDLISNPDLAAEPDNAVRLACLFWTDRNLAQFADADDIYSVTRRVNGGLNGIADRQAALGRIKAHLA